jgi:hypothetical protein
MRDLRDADLGVTLLLNCAAVAKSSLIMGDLTPRVLLTDDISVRPDFADKAGLVVEALRCCVARRGVIGLFTARLEARVGRNGRLFGLLVLLSSGMFALAWVESARPQHWRVCPCRGNWDWDLGPERGLWVSWPVCGTTCSVYIEYRVSSVEYRVPSPESPMVVPRLWFSDPPRRVLMCCQASNLCFGTANLFSLTR